MDNGKNVIARIPHPIAGPEYYTTASEVATMEFVCIHTSFPFSLPSRLILIIARLGMFWVSRFPKCMLIVPM